MISTTEEEIARDLADGNWWCNFARRLGWQCRGFSYRDTASFLLASGDTLTLTREARDDIARALAPEDARLGG